MPTNSPEQPRIAPGGVREIGRPTWWFMQLVTKRTGGPIPNVMRTLARHRGLFLPWLFYSSRLMPFGSLKGTESELIILRVASRTGSDYERHHHEALGAQAGLGADVMAWTKLPRGSSEPAPGDDGIEGALAELLVQATDELLDDRDLSDDTFAALSARFDERRVLEICLLAGHYAGLAATLKAARVQLEPGAGMHKLR
ncbi:MAG: carboxymuconolactone decarboxylase family protein [Solirubrobacteraceae bacterium]|nr:carboxymuconolactone decarboxylase family protein [Solirubrobacteraceae bacterium]